MGSQTTQIGSQEPTCSASDLKTRFFELSDPCSRDSTSQFYACCPALSPKRFPQLYIFKPSSGGANIFISIRTVERPDFLTFYFLKVLKNKIKVGLIWRCCKSCISLIHYVRHYPMQNDQRNRLRMFLSPVLVPNYDFGRPNKIFLPELYL